MDPIHGLIKINDFERDIIDTGVFQRLRRIKQLSSAFLVYPSAHHTRFEHCLGAMYMAGQMGESLKGKGYVNDEDVQQLRIAGLLHDVGHGPFSHLFEDVSFKRYGISHEDVARRVIAETEIGDVIKKHGYDPKALAELATGVGGGKPFMRAIIAGPLSADIMDYMQRDSYYTGALFGRLNVSKIINSMHVYNEQLAIERDALSAFESVTIARYEMFKDVYFHKTARAGDVMLQRAISLEDAENGFADPKNLEGYLALTDDTLIARLIGSKSEKVKELISDYLNRKLVKLVYESFFIGRDAFFEKIFNNEPIKERITKEIEEKSGIEEDSVFIDLPTVPSVPKTFEREELKGIYVIYKKETTEAKELTIRDFPALESISGYYNILRIYAKREIRDKAEKVVKELFKEGYSGKISV